MRGKTCARCRYGWEAEAPAGVVVCGCEGSDHFQHVLSREHSCPRSVPVCAGAPGFSSVADACAAGVPLGIVRRAAEATSGHNDGESRGVAREQLLRIQDYISSVVGGSND